VLVQMSKRPTWAVVSLFTVSNPAGAVVHTDCSIDSATSTTLPSGAVLVTFETHEPGRRLALGDVRPDTELWAHIIGYTPDSDAAVVELDGWISVSSLSSKPRIIDGGFEYTLSRNIRTRQARVNPVGSYKLLERFHLRKDEPTDHRSLDLCVRTKLDTARVEPPTPGPRR